MMNTERICPGCGRPLAADAPQGLCPQCLVKAGLGSGVSVATETRSGQKHFAAPSPGELAGRFPQLEIVGFIGQGGMGAVYKARQKQLDRIVALKILPPGIGDDPAFAERFAREAKALAKLAHPGIVTIHDFGCADGLFFFVMEFVDGVNLRQLLANGRVSSREALAIVPQICDALQYAHDEGVVHRDIKPENILLDRRGRVKVADFGLAKLIGGAVEPPSQSATPTNVGPLTEAGKILGTPNYIAPEQRQHPDEVDHRVDIYALGVVLYQMLTGELPGKPIEPPSRKVRVDVRLDEIVLRALEAEPERRYQQASVLKTAVETVAAGQPGLPEGATAAPPGRQSRSFTWTIDLRHWQGAVTLLLLLAAVSTLVLFAAGVFRSPPASSTSRASAPPTANTGGMAPAELRTVTIVGLYLMDGPEVPSWVNRSADHGQTDFLIAGKEWIKGTHNQMNRFMDHAGTAFFLTASNHPQLTVRYDGLKLSQGDGTFQAYGARFVEEDRAKMVPGVGYSIHPVNVSDIYKWVVSPDLPPLVFKGPLLGKPNSGGSNSSQNESSNLQLPVLKSRPLKDETYTITSVLQILQPVNPADMNDDYQDARVVAQDKDSCTVEVTCYPLYRLEVGENPNWRAEDSSMIDYLQPTPTENWDEAMRLDLLAQLREDGIEPDRLTDKQLVEQVSKWALRRAHSTHAFAIWAIDYAHDQPAVYPPLREAFERQKPDRSWTDEQMFEQEALGRSMFYQKVHGSCTSSSVYLATILRALGIPTRIVFFVPPFDPNDGEQAQMFYHGIEHHRVRKIISSALDKVGGFDNHIFNEVYVGQRWVRLNYSTLGQPVLDRHYFGLLTHIYTCASLSQAPLAQTWGLRYFRYPGQSCSKPEDEAQPKLSSINPYRLLSVHDHFGARAHLDNPPVPELRTVTIRGLLTKGSPAIPDWVREDAWQKSGSDFLISFPEWLPDDPNQMREFQKRVGREFLLTAADHAPVKARLGGLDLSQGDGQFQAFGAQIAPEDKTNVVPGVPYRIQPVNTSDTYRWALAPDLPPLVFK
jgi:serine/threonine protein kinase